MTTSTQPRGTVGVHNYLLGCCANCDELARQRFAEDQAAARELVSA